MDNFAVQVLPPNLSYEYLEDFDDGTANLFTGLSQGTWAVAPGTYTGTPGNGGIAFSLYDLSSEAGLAPGGLTFGANSKLKLTVEVSTSDIAGLIFDAVSEDRFKFAVLDVANDQVLIGHYEANRGWVVDRSVSFALKAGVTYELSILISGSTVAVAVDGATALSHAFNAVAVDGSAGLLTRGGKAVFSSVLIATDDPALAAVEPAALHASAIGDGAEALDLAVLPAIADEALLRLGLLLGLDGTQLERLATANPIIVDLPGNTLGQFENGQLMLDIDAAGIGWFVDPTPSDDAEYRGSGGKLLAIPGSGATDKIDLLSVLVHEFGHMLNLTHAQYGFMAETLETGVRTASTDLGSVRPSSRARLLDESSMLMIDADEARLLRVLDVRIEDLLDEDEQSLDNEEQTASVGISLAKIATADYGEEELVLSNRNVEADRHDRSGLNKRVVGKLVSWTERFNGVKSL
jgi:hypothetical protein